MPLSCKTLVGATVFCGALFLCVEQPRADEYGSRFYEQTPAGMMPYTMADRDYQIAQIEEIARELQDVAPAAGEEISEPPEPGKKPLFPAKKPEKTR